MSSESISLYFMFGGHFGIQLLPLATRRSISCCSECIILGSSLNLIYLPYWIQLLPIATRILFPVCLGFICESSITSILSIYIDYSCPWQQVIHPSESLQICLVTIFVVLSDNLSSVRQSESEITFGLYYLYIYILPL